LIQVQCRSRSPFFRPENIVHHTINPSTAKAPNASSKTNPMMTFLKLRQFLVTSLSALLLACSSSPYEPASSPRLDNATTLLRERSRWVATTWTELPGWELDATAELWPALLRSCERPAFEWARICADAKATPPAMNDTTVRTWLQQRTQPWRVETPQGNPQGLITGYFEPLIDASRVPTPTMQVPLYSLPTDLTPKIPYWTRQQLDTLPQAQAAIKGRELAYVADPLDALILQIQGSGRLNLQDAQGKSKLVRLAFAGHNEQPYKSIGRWLIDQGELRADAASWPTIKAWAQKNPQRVNEMLWSNPRTVFFREEPLPDPNLGPKGAQGVPLTPGRSIAVDSLSIPYGTPVWLDTNESLTQQPLRKLVMAQDTGGAITGAVRADYFWGWGQTAEQQAGRMKQPVKLWVLWPRGL
jgi:membrane-bound lytic murein transglycosylase A